jgi:hypothetical protein
VIPVRREFDDVHYGLSRCWNAALSPRHISRRLPYRLPAERAPISGVLCRHAQSRVLVVSSSGRDS